MNLIDLLIYIYFYFPSWGFGKEFLIKLKVKIFED